MEQKEKKPVELIRVPKTWVIAMVAAPIKGKILFPRKIEEAKRIGRGL